MIFFCKVSMGENWFDKFVLTCIIIDGVIIRTTYKFQYISGVDLMCTNLKNNMSLYI